MTNGVLGALIPHVNTREQAVRAVETILTKGVSVAMREFNRKVEPDQQ